MTDELTVFCNNIRKLRAYSHLSQRQFASLMGIGVGSLRNIERGVHPPRLGVQALFRVHRAFHIPIRELFLPWNQEQESRLLASITSEKSPVGTDNSSIFST